MEVKWHIAFCNVTITKYSDINMETAISTLQKECKGGPVV